MKIKIDWKKVSADAKEFILDAEANAALSTGEDRFEEVVAKIKKNLDDGVFKQGKGIAGVIGEFLSDFALDLAEGAIRATVQAHFNALRERGEV